MRSGGIRNTKVELQMKLNRNTEVESLQVSPPDAKPMLPAVASTVVYLEDCVQALKRFEDNYFDVISLMLIMVLMNANRKCIRS